MENISIPVAEYGAYHFPAALANLIQGTIPVRSGGTGIDSLTGGKLMASNEDGLMMEEIDVPVQSLAHLRGNIQDQLDKARTYIVAVPTTGWVENPDGDGYKQVIEVVGMLSEDNPVVALVTSSATTTDTLNDLRAAYDCIDKIYTGVDNITVYCFDETPTTAFSISLHCIGA